MFWKKSNVLRLGKDYDKNLKFLQQELGEGETFDLIIREIEISGKKAALICFDGLVKDDILTEIMEHFLLYKKERFKRISIPKLLEKSLPYIELSSEDNMDELLYAVLSGSILLIIDSYDEAFIIDARTYPARGPEEPEIERVVRGSRDGFTETIVYNTALIRRRVRDPKLRVELLSR